MNKKYAVWGIILLNIFYINYTINAFNTNMEYYFNFMYFMGLIVMGCLFFKQSNQSFKIAYYGSGLFTIIIGFVSPVFNILLMLNVLIILILFSIIKDWELNKQWKLKDMIKQIVIIIILLFIYLNYFILFKRFNIRFHADYISNEHIMWVVRYIIGIIFLIIYTNVLYYFPQSTNKFYIFKKNELNLKYHIMHAIMSLVFLFSALVYITRYFKIIPDLNYITNSNLIKITVITLSIILILVLSKIFQSQLKITYRPVILMVIIITLFPILWMNDTTYYNMGYLHRSKIYQLTPQALCRNYNYSSDNEIDFCVASPIYQRRKSLSVPHFYMSGLSKVVLFQKEIFGFNNHFTNRYLHELAMGKELSYIYDMSTNQLIPTDIINRIKKSEIVDLTVDISYIELMSNQNESYLYNDQGKVSEILIHSRKYVVDVLEENNDDFIVLSRLNNKPTWHNTMYGRIYTSQDDYYIEKVNKAGKVLWSNQILKNDISFLINVRISKHSNHYYITGYDRQSLHIIKFNEQGEIIFSQEIKNLDAKEINIKHVKSNGNMIVTYYPRNGQNKLSELTTEGKIIWDKSIGNSNYIKAMEDGFLSFIAPFTIEKYNYNGQLVWDQTLDQEIKSLNTNQLGDVFVITKDKIMKLNASGIQWQITTNHYSSHLYHLTNGNIIYVNQVYENYEVAKLYVYEYDLDGQVVNQYIKILPYYIENINLYFDEQDGFVLVENHVDNPTNVEDELKTKYLNMSYAKLIYLGKDLSEERIIYHIQSKYDLQFINSRNGVTFFNYSPVVISDNHELLTSGNIIGFENNDIQVISLDDLVLHDEVNIGLIIKNEMIRSIVITLILTIIPICLYTLKKLRR